MAQRKSAKMVRARERAEELACEDLAREQKRVELAASFFTEYENVERADEQLEEQIAQIRVEAERKIEAARSKSEERSAAARTQCAQIAREMIDTGLAQRRTAERLGLSAAALRRLLADVDTEGSSGRL